jgi:polyribonucleotide 5'-hydroxyl-kinase
LVHGIDELFTINPHSSSGQQAFTVNSAHILVLYHFIQPIVHYNSGIYTVNYSLCQNNQIKSMSKSFTDRFRAQALATKLRTSPPAIWEVSVCDYLESEKIVQGSCRMFQPAFIQFSPTNQSLVQYLHTIYPINAVNNELIKNVAWSIGLHIANYDQIDYNQQLIQLLNAFKLSKNSSVPHSLLTDQLSVRLEMMRAIIFAHPSTQRNNHTIISAHLVTLKSIQYLAKSLGCRACLTQQNDHFIMKVNVDNLANVEVYLESGERGAACNIDNRENSWSFDINAAGVGDYYGFTVRGANQRFLLSDCTVTHNTSLCKMLLNWSVRSGYKPIFIDLDCSNNIISIPGTIAATSVEYPIDAATANNSLTIKSPLSFFYGDITPLKNVDLYSKLLVRLSDSVEKRLKAVNSAREAGIIINAPPTTDTGGNEIILKVIESFKIDTLLILNNERLYAELKANSALQSVNIEKLAKSGGVVSRDMNYRKNHRLACIKQYFYGAANDLNPHQKVLSFKDFSLWKAGGNPIAPNTALPIGTKRLLDPNEPNKATPTLDLINCILAVSYSNDPSNLFYSPIAGFIYVSAVDMNKKTLTVLCPAPGPLPSNNFLLSNIKFIDQ